MQAFTDPRSFHPHRAVRGTSCSLADDNAGAGPAQSAPCSAGHGPIVEEDVAIANLCLDHLGQARLLYQLAATCIAAYAAQSARFAHLKGARHGGVVTEDALAYFRDGHEFRNHTLAELPHNGPLAGPARNPTTTSATIVARTVLRSDALTRCPCTTALQPQHRRPTGRHRRQGGQGGPVPPAPWSVHLGDPPGRRDRRERMPAHAGPRIDAPHGPITSRILGRQPDRGGGRAGSGTGVALASLTAVTSRLRCHRGRGHGGPGHPHPCQPTAATSTHRQAAPASTPNTWATSCPRCRALAPGSRRTRPSGDGTEAGTRSAGEREALFAVHRRRSPIPRSRSLTLRRSRACCARSVEEIRRHA